MAAVRCAARRHNLLAALCFAATSLLAACSAPPATPQQAAASAQEALPFDQAVAALAVSLVANARLGLPRANFRYPMVVDPWVDRVSGNQLEATRLIEAQIGALVREHYPIIELLPFTTESLQRQPLILLGAMAPVHGPGEVLPVAAGASASYRVWGVIGDLRTGRVVSQSTVWAAPEEVNIRPAAFFQDSPTWMPDVSAESYFRTISSRMGDPIDPAYLQGVQAGALVNDGIRAYEAGRYDAALASYDAARQMPAGDQIRVWNGLYLTNQALGRPDATAAAFRRVVGFGLANGRLAVKFVFRPGGAAFWPDPAISGLYPMWLREIAGQAAASGNCLLLTGHSSTSGAATANLRLSLLRADYVRARLLADEPSLRGRIRTRGVGAAEAIVGTGTDDASDLLDRRVEFQPVNCGTRTAGETVALPERLRG